MSSHNILGHNAHYYLHGGDLYLLAEKQIFRVHKYFFERESLKFRDELARPVARGERSRGSIESDPLLLSVRAADLEKFLWVFYLPTYNLYNASVDDWMVILTLAQEWGFHEVKNLSLRKLEEEALPVVDRIVLYRAHDVDEDILRKYYVELCARPEQLTVQDGDRLGMPIVIMITSIRERLRSRSANISGSPLPPDVNQERIGQVLDDYIANAPPLNETSARSAKSSAGRHASHTIRGRRIAN